MATQSPLPTIWGATQTTTFTTTATGTVGQVLYFAFPNLTTSQPLSYTTLPSPTDPNSKQFPAGLPILVITQVDGIIVNPSGQTLSTATIVQAPPASTNSTSTSTPGGAGKVDLMQPQPNSGWMAWSSGAKAGVVIAGVVCGLGLLAALWYVWAARQKRKRLERDMEKGPGGGGAGERKKGKRSYTKKKKASGLEERPGGIEGIEGVEMGPAARRSLQGDASSAMARKSGEPRASRKSADPRVSGRTQREEGNARAPVGEVGVAARGVAVAPLPVGQRPLHPPTPNQGTRVETRGRELVNRTGPSVVPVHMEARDIVNAPAAHNPLVDDDDSDDMVSNHSWSMSGSRSIRYIAPPVLWNSSIVI